jgi:hypothetical protein
MNRTLFFAVVLVFPLAASAKTFTIDLPDKMVSTSTDADFQHAIVVPRGFKIELSGGGAIVGPVTIDVPKGSTMSIYGEKLP